MSTISLCVIAGNEEIHIKRFLDAFKPAFDQLCIVRAVGRTPHDRTLSLAKDWCEKNGKMIKLGEYFNVQLRYCHPDAAEVIDGDPCTWPHVDDFAAARNQSWGLATCKFQFWADLDDIIDEQSAKVIRDCANRPGIDQFYFDYSIPTSGEQNFRERMFRTGTSHWSQPVHENCHIEPELALTPGKAVSVHEKGVVYVHQPLAEKEKIRDPLRNMRIMKFHLRYIHGFAYAIHQEHFYQWGAHRRESDMEQSFRWAKIAQQCDTLSPLQMQMHLNLAEMRRNMKDYDTAIDYAWHALRVNPGRREPWGVLGELELEAGQTTRATIATNLMQVIRPVAESGIPVSDRFTGSSGLTLRTRTLRAAGNDSGARELEDGVFQRAGARISLLHATRGRPELARITRERFFKTAFHQIAIEHCFAIDADDAEGLEALKHYRHIVIDNPAGCVKAWNALAAQAQGALLVQLSDDWIPSLHWDERIWQEAEQAAKKIAGDGASCRDVPLVLAVSDNHRTDPLLCMAILTQARYRQQRDMIRVRNEDSKAQPPRLAGVIEDGVELVKGDPYLFSPEYFGVFSDNEFSARAYRDGVVVDCRHIAFDHQHPVFFGKPASEWDATYQRQNAVERYAEGQAIFARRNPWAMEGAT